MRVELLHRIAALRELSTLVLLGLVVAVASVREPRFLQPESLNAILLWIPLLLIVAVGQMLVIITRGIDISVGSMVGLSGMAAGMLYRSNPGLSVFWGILAAVLVGLALGSINGSLVALARVPPIIATLGTLSAFRGLVFILSGGNQVDSNHLPTGLTALSIGGPIRWGGLSVPWILVIAAGVAMLGAWFVRKARAGRDVFAVGSNPVAAELRGVKVRRATFLVYAITGGLCGLAGVLYASRFGFVNPATAGLGMELSVIAAVVIGGVKITGGSGSVLGVVLGCLLLGTINVALSVLGIAGTWQLLVYGLAILIALIIDSWLQKSIVRLQKVGR